MPDPDLSFLPDLLNRTADLLRLSGANDFKAGAWNKAAVIVEQEGEGLRSRSSEADLKELPGIGSSLASELHTFLTEGILPQLIRLEEELPDSLIQWLDISGLGPKRAAKIHQKLDIDTLEQLQEALKDGRVAALPGFGETSAKKLLNSLAWMEGNSERCLLSEALDMKEWLREELEDTPGLQRLEFAGSLRRSRESIGDLDILAVTSGSDTDLHRRFVRLDQVAEVLVSGDTKSSVRLQSGRQVDLRTVSENEFPAALIYFTGSKEHNVFLRSRAREKGLTLNEYGLYPLVEGEADRDHPLNAEDEAAVYAHLDLPWTPPELRESGYQSWIQSDRLPVQVNEEDLKGILHAHSTWSDGTHTLEEMARACMDLGYQYLGITDHSQSAVYANGLTPDRVEAQWKEIETLNQRFQDEGMDFRIFKGIESDIKRDGSLDYEDDLLTGFDFVIASLHNHFDLEKPEQQERVEKALQHPATTLMGHPTARLVLRRPGVKLDMDAVIRLAARQGVGIELNATAERMELDWKWGPLAREVGLLTAVCPDAHRIEHIPHAGRFGIPMARKGGFEPDRILNTLSATDFLKRVTG